MRYIRFFSLILLIAIIGDVMMVKGATNGTVTQVYVYENLTRNKVNSTKTYSKVNEEGQYYTCGVSSCSSCTFRIHPVGPGATASIFVSKNKERKYIEGGEVLGDWYLEVNRSDFVLLGSTEHGGIWHLNDHVTNN